MRIPKLLELREEAALGYGIAWTKDYFNKARIKKAVIGLSGGSDSAFAALITARAIGSENVTAMMLPEEGVTPKADMDDAKELISGLGLKDIYQPINDVLDAITADDVELLAEKNRVAYGNVKARTRMVLLYKEANKTNAMVVGTDDRSENLLGYFTKYGDGGVDINVPEYLYKTQVQWLLQYSCKKGGLKVMQKIADKKPSPQLWKGHLAESELKVDYTVLDQALYYINDYGTSLTTKELISRTGAPLSVIEDIKRRIKENTHKKIIPPSPPVKKDLFKA